MLWRDLRVDELGCSHAFIASPYIFELGVTSKASINTSRYADPQLNTWSTTLKDVVSDIRSPRSSIYTMGRVMRKYLFQNTFNR